MVEHLNSATNKPLVSVIIPTLNAGNFLATALQSVFSQTYPHFEVIMIDGGSSDSTLDLAKSHPQIKIFQQESSGLASAWNEGIIKSKGELIAFLDSDDIWLPTCLENHITAFQVIPNLMASLGRVEFFLNSTSGAPPGFKLSLLQGSHIGNMPGCFMGKRYLFHKLGMFETRWKIASDLVWFAKLRKQEPNIHELEQVCLRKRVHHSNLSYTTAQTPLYQNELLRFLAEKIRKDNER
jgi:glycosyltransferase involved in cell wall biosynthesis